jgi:hypothetical protein
MSFSYKTLNSNDITLTSYIANKQWEVINSTLSQNGVTIYMGENLPINKLNPFDPLNDSETSNDEYRRLIYDSIKNLYYQNYTSGSLTGQFFNSSSFFNYEQSTLTSGSMLSAHRDIPTITGSSALGIRPTVFGTNLYDISSSLYDTIGYDPDKGSKITVISIDQNIFGSGLSPNTIILSGSTYNIQDDGEGNLLDINTSTYVGNVFYSQGLIVITNQIYICVLGAPPVSVNDYYSYRNTEYASQTLDIISNDFADCGAIDPTSVEIYGTNFPDYTINNGIITITPNQTSFIPGIYQLEYTVGNYNSIRSNTSSINLEITSLPLEINNITTDKVCYGVTGSLDVSFDINYGVPYYSYSLDGGVNYTGSSTIFNATITGSMPAGINNIIYVKDYTNNIYSASFSSWHKPTSYTTTILKNPCSGTSNDGQIYVEDDGTFTAYQARIDFSGLYTNIPVTFTGLSTGSHTIQVRDINSCITSSVVTLGVYTQLTASVTQSNVSCYGGSNGALSIALTNVTDTLLVNLLGPTGSYIYNNVLLSSFSNNIITASNLTTGSYILNVTASGGLQCQSYNNTFPITSPTALSFNITASYINSCSNAISFSATGGTPPYIYMTYETGSGISYSSDSSSVSIDSLNPGYYKAFVIDSNGCSSTTSSIQIFGRDYKYTGSYCVTSSGQNTGYVSSSGIQQIFTSGPYSGSVVTSSYSNGTNLFGPTINFTQNFISGSIDKIRTYCSDILYQAYYENTASCAISGCFAPILTLATPLNCNGNWQSEYTLTYNSASANASYTVVEYGVWDDFSDYATHTINNSSPSILPLSFYDDYGDYVDNNSTMYFRAYNSCSNGSLSSYSNIITASCGENAGPPTSYGSVYIKVINNTSNALQILNPNGSQTISTYTNLAIGQSYSYLVATGGYNSNDPDNPGIIPLQPYITITTVGSTSNSQTQQDSNGNDLWKVTITSNDPIGGNVNTRAESLIDSYTYPTQNWWDGYTTGNNQFIYVGSNDWIINISSGHWEKELRIDADRTFYGENFTITCSIDNVTP